MSDFKDGARVKASREQWKKLQEEKRGPCRVSGLSPHMGVELHHLCPRSQGGDDVANNLVPLSREVHRKVEANDYETRSRLRANLSDAEIAYCIEKKGHAWLERRYPMPDLIPGALSEGDGAGVQVSPVDPTSPSESVLGRAPQWGAHAVMGHEVFDMHTHEKIMDLGPTPGKPCPTCQRKVPEPYKGIAKRKRVSWTTKVPQDEQENGAEILDTLHEQAEEMLGRQGQPKYYTLAQVYAFFIQSYVPD
jgi:hypothetical protein